MRRISKFDVLLLMQQLDELLENHKEENKKENKQKNARNR
ncbi:hypothetical protein C8K15_10563 [Paenisporosarcina sp. OV554]|nr:hypothetical protein C8K15_10563 [Paenisporosarcina sp. OV554]